MTIKFAVAAAGLALASGVASANGSVVINEVLGSTTSSDTEFIELYNSGLNPVDISGWQIELWDSDDGSIGGGDGGAPYIVPAGTTIAPGAFFLFANSLAEGAFGVTADFSLPANAIENSSYTIVLSDPAAAIDAFFVTDGDAGDAANRNGDTSFVPKSGTVGPDGTFLPAGFYRVGDGSSNIGLLEFAPIPAASATPGAPNIPAPGAVALAGIAGLAAGRRRRA